MEEARANQARRLARLQAQQQPQPEPQAEPVRPPPGLADMPDEAIRNIVRLAASSPRATQYWHIPMMRDLARLAPVNRSFRDQARGMSNLFPEFEMKCLAQQGMNQPNQPNQSCGSKEDETDDVY